MSASSCVTKTALAVRHSSAKPSGQLRRGNPLQARAARCTQRLTAAQKGPAARRTPVRRWRRLRRCHCANWVWSTAPQRRSAPRRRRHLCRTGGCLGTAVSSPVANKLCCTAGTDRQRLPQFCRSPGPRADVLWHGCRAHKRSGASHVCHCDRCAESKIQLKVCCCVRPLM